MPIYIANNQYAEPYVIANNQYALSDLSYCPIWAVYISIRVLRSNAGFVLYVRAGCVGVAAGWRGAGERGAGDQRSSARRGQGQGRREGQSAKG